jgi:hypothetical protein
MVVPSDWQPVDLTWDTVPAYAEQWIDNLIAGEADPLARITILAFRERLIERAEHELRCGLMDVCPA